jgi:hypothetical protein
MKALLKNLIGVDPRYNYQAGIEIEIHRASYSEDYMISKDGCYIPMGAIEGPIERFTRLAATASKVIVSVPTKGYTVDVLQTESYLVMYSHSKGNHYNVFGNHYRYYHDVNTGEYIREDLTKNEKVEWKQRLLKAVAQKIQQIGNKVI